MLFTEQIHVITNEQCMNDETFNWTSDVNDFLRSHTDIKKRLIIYASSLMDTMVVTFFIMFFLYWRTYRIIISITIFFATRALV